MCTKVSIALHSALKSRRQVKHTPLPCRNARTGHAPHPLHDPVCRECRPFLINRLQFKLHASFLLLSSRRESSLLLRPSTGRVPSPMLLSPQSTPENSKLGGGAGVIVPRPALTLLDAINRNNRVPVLIVGFNITDFIRVDTHSPQANVATGLIYISTATMNTLDQRAILVPGAYVMSICAIAWWFRERQIWNLCFTPARGMCLSIHVPGTWVLNEVYRYVITQDCGVWQVKMCS